MSSRKGRLIAAAAAVVLLAARTFAAEPPSGEKLALLSMIKARADMYRCEDEADALAREATMATYDMTAKLRAHSSACDRVAGRARAEARDFQSRYPADAADANALTAAIRRLGISRAEMCATGADGATMRSLGFAPCR